MLCGCVVSAVGSGLLNRSLLRLLGVLNRSLLGLLRLLGVLNRSLLMVLSGSLSILLRILGLLSGSLRILRLLGVLIRCGSIFHRSLGKKVRVLYYPLYVLNGEPKTKNTESDDGKKEPLYHISEELPACAVKNDLVTVNN